MTGERVMNFVTVLQSDTMGGGVEVKKMSNIV